MNKNHNRRNTKGAFTLIELLIVIAIIAILAAILFPVFARARENARRTSCSSNLKQLGLGVMQYIQDYDETYPFNWDYDGGGSITNPELEGWRYYMQPYVKSVQIFQCPSSAPPSGTTTANIKITTPSATGISVAFRYNYAANANIIRKQTFTATPAVPLKISAMQRPSEMLLIADSLHNNLDSDIWTVVNASKPVVNVSAATDAGSSIEPESARHLGGSNIVFADGHVKWLPQGKIGPDPTRTTQSSPRDKFGVAIRVEDDRVQ